LIGRLACDKRAQGRGVGSLLLADAVRRILSASKALAVFAIVIDAKGPAITFFEGFGFRSLPLHPDRLFLLASSAGSAIQKLDE
jgi:GNAT superfamily N-acetyltransferase